MCSDPLEVYKHMEEKNICLNDHRFWTSKAGTLCQMGEYATAVDELIATKEKALPLSKTKAEYEEFIYGVENKLNEIEQEIITLIKR